MPTKMIIHPLPGESLFEAARRAGITVPSPCGGNGICNKCKIFVDGVGWVRSCTYYPDHDVEINLPETSAMQVLTESFWPDPQPVPDTDLITDDRFLGLAVDLGTTTVVVFLDDLKTHRNIGVQNFPNPQHSYGADVISRIQFCSEHDHGTDRLHQVILSAIEQASDELCRQQGFTVSQVRQMAVTGNPTMLHLFKGVSPESLAYYPFTPIFLEEQHIVGKSIGCTLLCDTIIHILPSVSGYIGSDIVAGLSSVSFNPPEGWSLFLDIGTNGEMVLWNGETIVACATAAGPAFEGARISCGMAGVAGALNAIYPDHYETIGGKPAMGLCGSGLVDAVALLIDRGKIDPTGYMENPEKIMDNLDIYLTPQDIREVQLAKGAVAAGIGILMQEAGIGVNEISRVFMAGGFGYALHEWSAVRIGLIPGELEKRQIRAGNTSGLGARLWLHSDEFRTFTRALTAKIRYVELSDHPEFNDLFMMEMSFTPSK